jgi:hypothetical protein
MLTPIAALLPFHMLQALAHLGMTYADIDAAIRPLTGWDLVVVDGCIQSADNPLPSACGCKRTVEVDADEMQVRQRSQWRGN